MAVRGAMAAVLAAGVLAGCSTLEPYGAEQQLVAAPRQAVAVVQRPAEPVVQVGPDGPTMTERELNRERLRRMRDRVRLNPGLRDAAQGWALRDDDYGDVLRR